jgi:Fe-S-cluster containining protein
MDAVESVQKPTTITLHIPDGIHYECTGCGKCCGGWAIPMTEEDYDRVSAHDWAEMNPLRYSNVTLFRPLKDWEKKGTPYTHAIKEGNDGHCPFLVDNLCYIHSKFDSKEKPSMCQLFPYCFNETPSGYYATLSFNSVGVLMNSGTALSEQRSHLESKLHEFTTLYPDHHPNWSDLKLTTGMPMTWDDYLAHEAVLLGFLNDKSVPIEERFINGSQYLISKVRGSVSNETEAGSAAVPPSSQQLKRLDKHLMVALHKIYFPVKSLGRGEGDFNVGRFFYQLAFQGTRFAFPAHHYRLEELSEVHWPEANAEVEDLLYRYFFCRIFGKLYFGAGFGQLSLVAGFHHLAILLALIKLEAKGHALNRDASTVDMIDLMAAVRQAEKRLGETHLDGYAAGIWELLMFSPQRIKRILAAVSAPDTN